MAQYFQNFILAAVVLFAQASMAQAPLCQEVFHSAVTIPHIMDKNAGPTSTRTTERVTELAFELLKSNAKALAVGEYRKIEHLSESPKIDLRLKRVNNTENKYATYEFYGSLSKEGTPFYNFNVEVRSNGEVAFIDRTWQYRINTSTDVKKYNAVYFDGDKIRSADQGEAILRSLPEAMTISRNMSGKERTRWINGESYFPSRLYGLRVHFMPNKSQFDAHWEPYYIHFTRQELLDFYNRGELEINIYEVNTRMDLTNVPLNFEFVFIGEQAVQHLAPYMQKQLSEQPEK